MFYLTSKRPAYSNVLTANYYISPSGNDNNTGTITAPFRSIEKACSVAAPGNLIYARGGRYYPLTPSADPAMNLTTVPDGTEVNPIRIWNYPGEVPVIDLSTKTHSGTTSCAGFKFTGNYWHWKGFHCTGMPQFTTTNVNQSFWFRDCNNVTVENCQVYDNYSMGLSLGAAGVQGHNNRIINCDMYRNNDAGTTSDPSGNADGIHITIDDPTAINYVHGCRMWDNSDDGFDSFYTHGLIYISNSLCYHNGFLAGTETQIGDGNGFKFGQGLTTYTTVKRVVTNCISTRNAGHGFDGNSEKWPVHIFNCTAYLNGPTNYAYGFRLTNATATHVVENCLSYGNQYTSFFGAASTHTNNSWNAAVGVTVTNADFADLTVGDLLAPRKLSGELPTKLALRLASNSDLIGKGLDLGYGRNLGAY